MDIVDASPQPLLRPQYCVFPDACFVKQPFCRTYCRIALSIASLLAAYATAWYSLRLPGRVIILLRSKTAKAARWLVQLLITIVCLRRTPYQAILPGMHIRTYLGSAPYMLRKLTGPYSYVP